MCIRSLYKAFIFKKRDKTYRTFCNSDAGEHWPADPGQDPYPVRPERRRPQPGPRHPHRPGRHGRPGHRGIRDVPVETARGFIKSPFA